MISPLRALVVDDHPVFRAGIRAQLDLSATVDLIHETGTGEDAVLSAAKLQPDVVLMDLHLPGLNGIDATREIVEADPRIGVLVLTMFEDDESVFAAMRAGARGYLLKGAGGPQIVRAIEAVGNGEAIFGPEIGRRIADFLSTPARPHNAFPDLTARERDVLELLARGWVNHRIAKHLVLSDKTIRNHVSNIFAKLRVDDRSTAIDHARDAGFGRTETTRRTGRE
jgi:DNA-binding NarL/FixJ family response regulator